MSQSAFERYLKIHDESRHQLLHQRLAVALRRDPSADLVNQGLNLISAAALEVCEHPQHTGATLQLAIFCHLYGLDLSMIDLLAGYLSVFARGRDRRLLDFAATAKALFAATRAYDDLYAASQSTSAIHSATGRTTNHLLVAAEYLVMSARHLLINGHDSYVREKLARAEERLGYARQESQSPQSSTSQ